jgi:hypothetical protein
MNRNDAPQMMPGNATSNQSLEVTAGEVTVEVLMTTVTLLKEWTPQKVHLG